MNVDTALIRPSPYQPRLRFNIEDLKEEIRKDGLLSDLVVRKRDGFYELIDGDRRLRTLKELGWKQVPVQIRDVDDKIARLSVYKLNKIRENYTIEEEARYFKKLADEGMRPYEIAQALDVADSWVTANLNVFKFPQDIQEAVFSPGGKITVYNIKQLEPMIGRSMKEAIAIAREIILRGMQRKEIEKTVEDRLKPVEEARIKAAEEVLPKIAPKVTKLRKPEDFEAAAKALKKEATRRRIKVMTPKERVRLEAEKKRKREEKRKRREEQRLKEKQKIKEEVKREILKEPDVIREIAKLPVKDIRGILKERAKVKQKAYGGVALTKFQEVREDDLVHKVIVGDARQVLKLMPDSSVDLVVTSPPYFDLKEYPDNPLRVNTQSLDRYLEDLEAIFDGCFRVLRDGTFLCVVIGQFTSEEVSHFIPSHIAQLLESIGFRYRREHIWMKPLGIQGLWNRGTTSFLKEPYPRNTMINIHHEHVLIFQKGDKPSVFHGRNPLTEDEIKQWCWSIWELPVSKVKEHPAPFPEAIAERLIKMYSYEGEIVLDPFLGSGTTIKMAKTFKRRSIGIDVASEYLPLIQKMVGGAEIIRHDKGKTPDFTYLTETSLAS